MKPKAVVLLSGGLDSATAAAQAIADGYEVIALSVRYGQRHQQEILAAKRIAESLGISQHFTVDVDLAQWGGSALTDETVTVPTTGVEPGVIPITYVPGRNTVFLAIALSLAEAKAATAIYLGINAVDYSGYPDCHPEYLTAYQQLAALSSKPMTDAAKLQLTIDFGDPTGDPQKQEQQTRSLFKQLKDIDRSPNFFPTDANSQIFLT